MNYHHAFSFVFAFLMLIFASYAMGTYIGLSKKTVLYDTTDDEKDACGVKKGTISSGIAFSTIVIIVVILFGGYSAFYANKD